MMKLSALEALTAESRSFGLRVHEGVMIFSCFSLQNGGSGVSGPIVLISRSLWHGVAEVWAFALTVGFKVFDLI